ncbi:MAG: von Willebrand factor type A domain-containing protein [Pirellulales bacterium]
MNEDFRSHHSIDPELQVRLLNLVLGETSDFERDQLQALMEQRADLAAYHQHLQHMHGLLCDLGRGEWSAGASEVVADDDMEHESWRLSGPAREKLLAVLETQPGVAQPSSAKVVRWSERLRPYVTKRRFVEIATVGCCAALLLGLMLPSVQMARVAARRMKLADNAEKSLGEATKDMRVDYFESAAPSIAPSSMSSSMSFSAQGQSLPTPYYLNDDIQYFPAPGSTANGNVSHGDTTANSRDSHWAIPALPPIAASEPPPAPAGSKGYATPRYRADASAGEGVDKSSLAREPSSAGRRMSRAGAAGAPAPTNGALNSEPLELYGRNMDSNGRSDAKLYALGDGEQAELGLKRMDSNAMGSSVPGDRLALGVDRFDDGLSKLKQESEELERKALSTDADFKSGEVASSVTAPQSQVNKQEDALAQIDVTRGSTHNSRFKQGSSAGNVKGKESFFDQDSDAVKESKWFDSQSHVQNELSQLAAGKPGAPSDESKSSGQEPMGGVKVLSDNIERNFQQAQTGPVSPQAANGSLDTIAAQPSSKPESIASAYDVEEDFVGSKSKSVDGKDNRSSVSEFAAGDFAVGEVADTFARNRIEFRGKVPEEELVELGKKLAPAKRSIQVPAPSLSELSAVKEPFSTFSLHVSDVSFKLAQAALNQGQMPEADKIRIEEFVNALDYRDPLPNDEEKVACRIEQAIHPFLMQRNLLRISLRTAAIGRAAGTPLRLTILLDNSGSMERPDRRAAVLRAFQTLLAQLNGADQVTLISFAGSPRLLADRVAGDQRETLTGLIEKLPSEGGTNIESALKLAREKALEQRTDNAQNRIVLITDGAVNLGDADPKSLSKLVTQLRDSGIAFDAAGVCAQGLNDEVLESLTRQGDGRYYLLESAESVDEAFAAQIAGALRPSALNVKVQVEFNPQRVGHYKLLGFEKHRLNQEDFRNDRVDAAELAAEEAGVAVYQFESLPTTGGAAPIGDIGSVSVRFRDAATGRMVERRWPIAMEPGLCRLDQSTPTMQMAAVAGLFAEKLAGGAPADTVDLNELARIFSAVPGSYAEQPRVQQLKTMIEQTRSLK